MVSIAFSIYSFVIYLKFENPNIIYSKDNDKTTNRTIHLKDTLLMFSLIDSSFKTINESNAYFKAVYVIIDYNLKAFPIQLNIEKCEIGKNIDIKYKNLINDIEQKGYYINNFYCINKIFGNLSLFYTPNYGYSSLYIYPIISNNTEYYPENIQSIILTESDIIDHNNKSNPFSQNYNYQITSSFSSNYYTKINYFFQYIKYESDEGIIFKNVKTLNSQSFSNIDYSKYVKNYYSSENRLNSFNESTIGEIVLEINKSNYDHYKRIYPRIQSLLTEITTVVNLLFSIGHHILKYLLARKMNKDIIKTLLEIDLDSNQIKLSENFNQQNAKIKNLYKINEKYILKSWRGTQNKIFPELNEINLKSDEKL